MHLVAYRSMFIVPNQWISLPILLHFISPHLQIFHISQKFGPE